MPAFRDPTPTWLRPEHASVLDSPVKKALRWLVHANPLPEPLESVLPNPNPLTMAADPIAQALSIMGGVKLPGQYVFHGTTLDRLKKIARRGLRTERAGETWARSAHNSVYVTDNKFDARQWARGTAHNAPGPLSGQPAVLKIALPDNTEFIPDTGAGRGASGEKRLRLERNISPRHIETVSYQMPDGEWVEKPLKDFRTTNHDR